MSACRRRRPADDDDPPVRLDRHCARARRTTDVDRLLPARPERGVAAPVRVQPCEHDLVRGIATAGDEDLAVRLDRHSVGGVIAAEVDGLLAGDAEGRVERAVGVESSHREVAATDRVGRADEHQLAVRLARHVIRDVVAAKVDHRGARSAAGEGRVECAVCVQPLGDEVFTGIALTRDDDLLVGEHDHAAADVVHARLGAERRPAARAEAAVGGPIRSEPSHGEVSAAGGIRRPDRDDSPVWRDRHVRGTVGAAKVERLRATCIERSVEVAGSSQSHPA